MSDSDDETPTDHQLKFVLLGDGASGKVSFVDELLKPLRLMESGTVGVEKRPSKIVVCSNYGTYYFLDIDMCEVFSGELRQSLQANVGAGLLFGENSFTRFVSCYKQSDVDALKLKFNSWHGS